MRSVSVTDDGPSGPGPCLVEKQESGLVPLPLAGGLGWAAACVGDGSLRSGGSPPDPSRRREEKGRPQVKAP